MGQEPYNDRVLIELLCARLADLANTISTKVSTAWFADEVIEGQRIRARISLLPDYERNDGSLCARVFVRRIGTGQGDERAIYIRWGEPGRRLDDPKTWRKLGKLQKDDGSKTIAQNSRDIYWSEEAPAQDLEAQLRIALTQMRLLSENSDALKWLAEYVRDNYRIRFPTQGSRQDDTQARYEISARVADKLIKQWSFPENLRAFRRYVSRIVQVARGETLGLINKEASSGGREPWANRIELEDTSVGRMFQNPTRQMAAQFAHDGARLTVDEVSDFLGISKRYVYRLCQKGRITAKRHPILIPRSEMLRIRCLLELKSQRQDEKAKMEGLGKTANAARKASYRMHGPLPKLAR